MTSSLVNCGLYRKGNESCSRSQKVSYFGIKVLEWKVFTTSDLTDLYEITVKRSPIPDGREMVSLERT